MIGEEPAHLASVCEVCALCLCMIGDLCIRLVMCVSMAMCTGPVLGSD